MIKYLLSLFSILILLVPNGQAATLAAVVIIPSQLDTTPKPISPDEDEFEEEGDEDEVFTIVEYLPHFAGCEGIEDKTERKKCSDEKIIEFISENVKYPLEARKQGMEGTAVVRFIVQTDGSLYFEKDKAILRDPGGGCGKEALRVIQSMPDWVPGKHKGHSVKVQFTLPIKFELTDDIPEFQEITIKWDGSEIKGQYKTGDPAEYVRAICTLDKAAEILSRKTKGIPVMLQSKGATKKGFVQYYMSVGKSGKKQLVNSTAKNKGLKQKMLKNLESGKTIYFYNWEFKRTFMEISVK